MEIFQVFVTPHCDQRSTRGPTGSLSELMLDTMATPPEEGFMILILILFKSSLVLLKITYRLFYLRNG